jgi:D-glycero-alpha-D-manno-heptose 1-phosphate guanylyltransferase
MNARQGFMVEVVIIAGGQGTRLRSVVNDRPKPMADVQGKPFLEHLMSFCVAHGVSHFVMSLGYKHEFVVNHFGSSFLNVPISYAIEQEPLGTGGGLRLACEKLREDAHFLALNGDSFFNLDIKKFLEFHLSNEAAFSIAAFRAHQRNRFGNVVTNSHGKVTGFDTKKCEVGGVANGGVYLINPLVLKNYFYLKKNFSIERELVPKLINVGEAVQSRVFNGDFIDIGSPEDYRLVQNKVLI